MPWNLTTPVNCGDLDSAGQYAQVNITSLHIDVRNRRMMVELEYGNTVDGAWVSGHYPAGKDNTLFMCGQDFRDFVQANRVALKAVRQAVYDILVADGIIDPGVSDE